MTKTAEKGKHRAKNVHKKRFFPEQLKTRIQHKKRHLKKKKKKNHSENVLNKHSTDRKRSRRKTLDARRH